MVQDKSKIKYEVFFVDAEENAWIRILEGKFKGFVYNYDVVKVGDFEDEDAESVPLTYSYELREAPSTFETNDEESDKKEFEKVIGDVLYNIIVASAQMIINEGDMND